MHEDIIDALKLISELGGRMRIANCPPGPYLIRNGFVRRDGFGKLGGRMICLTDTGQAVVLEHTEPDVFVFVLKVGDLFLTKMSTESLDSFGKPGGRFYWRVVNATSTYWLPLHSSNLPVQRNVVREPHIWVKVWGEEVSEPENGDIYWVSWPHFFRDTGLPEPEGPYIIDVKAGVDPG